MIQNAKSTLTTSQNRAPKLCLRSASVGFRPATASERRCR